jgi:hypothetical protein
MLIGDTYLLLISSLGEPPPRDVIIEDTYQILTRAMAMRWSLIGAGAIIVLVLAGSPLGLVKITHAWLRGVLIAVLALGIAMIAASFQKRGLPLSPSEDGKLMQAAIAKIVQSGQDTDEAGKALAEKDALIAEKEKAMAAKDELIAGQTAQLEEMFQRLSAVREEEERKTAKDNQIRSAQEVPDDSIIRLAEDYKKATADLAAVKQTNEALTAKVQALENQLKARGGARTSKAAAPKSDRGAQFPRLAPHG